jgi:hypothetical protein
MFTKILQNVVAKFCIHKKPVKIRFWLGPNFGRPTKFWTVLRTHGLGASTPTSGRRLRCHSPSHAESLFTESALQDASCWDPGALPTLLQYQSFSDGIPVSCMRYGIHAGPTILERFPPPRRAVGVTWVKWLFFLENGTGSVQPSHYYKFAALQAENRNTSNKVDWNYTNLLLCFFAICKGINNVSYWVR